MRELEDVFGSDGPLARALPGYAVRREQLRMAEAVAGALESREPLLVEAGTGTGKTFAYLVPALLCGLRVLVSTGTRTLQDQLFAKDLPLIAAALGRPARVALLKGRANYLCRHRFDAARAQMPLEGLRRGSSRLLGRIGRWAAVTRTGDLAEVPGLADSSPVWAQVTSTRDNCPGVRCPQYDDCHVVAARRAAQEADLVIVNHHLLLADLALKEDGFGDLLGSADAVILDEAHQIPDLATRFFGTTVSGRQVETLLAEARALRMAHGLPMPQVESALVETERRLRALAAVLPRAVGRRTWETDDGQAEAAARALVGALEGLGTRLAEAADEPTFAAATARARELAAGFTRVVCAQAEEGARTVETSARGFSLGLLPFDISERFQSLATRQRSAWIFTSATLSVGGDFGHFAERLGLDGARTLQIDSPFGYEEQGLLYLPEGMPDPASPAFLEAVIAQAQTLIEASQGAAFVLFTSHRALAKAAGLMRQHRAGDSSLPLFVQGEAPREQLLREFRVAGNGVLLGTTSFWEGVDVKGEALRLVVIEKLPFASPEDPLVRARIAFLQSRGVNAFAEYQLPEAVLALKQGVGRLIRSEADHGVVAICDPRLVTRGYGRVFLASLPPFARTRDEAEARRFLRRHAPAIRAATRVRA